MAFDARIPPLVAIPADISDLGGFQWHGATETYLRAITSSLGGIPLIIPSFADAIDIDALLERVDGILLTGSRSNVHPHRYGASAELQAEPHDHARDAMAMPLIKAK